MGGFANNAPIVTDGLVFYVDAGNGNSYPGSGTTWTDLINSVQLIANNVDAGSYDVSHGGLFSLDGTNQHFRVNDGSLTYDRANFSVEAPLDRTSEHPPGEGRADRQNTLVV